MYGAEFKNMDSGCGLILMHGYIKSTNSDVIFKPALDAISEIYRSNGAGTIIATLGTDQLEIGKDKNLLAWGFVPALSYPNLRHGDGWTQTLWHKTLKNG